MTLHGDETLNSQRARCLTSSRLLGHVWLNFRPTVNRWSEQPNLTSSGFYRLTFGI